MAQRITAPVDEDAPAPARDSIDELTERVASGEQVPQADVDQLTAFFLGERKARPGSAKNDTKTFAVNLATRGSEEWECTIHSITWEQWQEAQRLGSDRVRGEDRPNQFNTASYAVAFALVKPDLGAVRMQLPEDSRPVDTAEMMRDFFRMQPGSLIDVQTEVLKLSRLALVESAVREVDAAKN